jgi:hypothetical protein
MASTSGKVRDHKYTRIFIGRRGFAEKPCTQFREKARNAALSGRRALACRRKGNILPTECDKLVWPAPALRMFER